MARHLLFCLVFFSTALAAQKPADRIAAARKELLAAFVADDPAGASLWRDSLMKLEDSTRVALVWDERWLLYYWEEAYGNLFDEVSRFDAAERQNLADRQQPPADGLFACLDSTLYERRFLIYESISRGFLTEEEKQFALIQLDYLLRLNRKEQQSGEWNKRLDAFAARYPESKFGSYLKSNLYAPAAPAYQVQTDRGFSFDLLFSSGRWRNQLERTLRSPYGFDVGLAYWAKGWTFGLRCNFSWQKLSRPIYLNGYEWPKNDPSSVIIPSMEVGYDLVSNPKFRLFPALGAGVSILKPPGEDETDEDSQPEYYSDFFFARIFAGAALNADVKVRIFTGAEEDAENLSYISVRVRTGYNWLNWNKDNPDLSGHMFYIAVGINLFGHSME